jgi:hypothetical protein
VRTSIEEGSTLTGSSILLSPNMFDRKITSQNLTSSITLSEISSFVDLKKKQRQTVQEKLPAYNIQNNSLSISA